LLWIAFLKKVPCTLSGTRSLTHEFHAQFDIAEKRELTISPSIRKISALPYGSSGARAAKNQKDLLINEA